MFAARRDLPCRIVDEPGRRADRRAAQAVAVEPAEVRRTFRSRCGGSTGVGAGSARSRPGGPRAAHRHRPGARSGGQGARRGWRRRTDRSFLRVVSDRAGGTGIAGMRDSGRWAVNVPSEALSTVTGRAGIGRAAQRQYRRGHRCRATPTTSSDTPCRLNGGGLVGNGCVGYSTSPGTSAVASTIGHADWRPQRDVGDSPPARISTSRMRRLSPTPLSHSGLRAGFPQARTYLGEALRQRDGEYSVHWIPCRSKRRESGGLMPGY